MAQLKVWDIYMQPQPGQDLAALDKKAHDEHSDKM